MVAASNSQLAVWLPTTLFYNHPIPELTLYIAAAPAATAAVAAAAALALAAADDDDDSIS